MELYDERVNQFGKVNADRRFILDVLLLFRPSIIKPKDNTYRLNGYGMFKTNLKIAFRNFKREISYTCINILGLALGISCCLLIGLWVQDELKFDRFHENGKNIYQVLRNATYSGGQLQAEFGTAYPIGDALIEDTPEVKARTRYATQHDLAFKINDQLVEKDLVAVDPEFLEVFSFPLIEGNPKTCLSNQSNMVISESIANALFPDGKAIGRVVTILYDENKLDFNISGIFKNLPKHSTLQFDALIHLDNFLRFNSTYKSWGNSWLHTFVELDENASSVQVNNKVADLPKRAVGLEWFDLNLQPFEDRYLYTEFKNGQPVGGRFDNVVLFSVVAIITLLISCFNFVNLTTARSVRRSKEIGIKKIIGAKRSSLIGQLLLESTILVLVSVIIAILISQICLPFFNDLASKQVSIDLTDLNFYLILMVVTVGVILLSGVYPSLFLSSFYPIKALKGKITGGLGQTRLTNGLIVVQFSLAAILIAGALIINSQLSYIHNKYLGFDKENIILVDLDAKTYQHKQEILNRLSGDSDILDISGANEYLIGETIGRSSDPQWIGRTNEKSHWFSIFNADFGLLEMLDMQLVDGRYFSPEYSTDTMNYIINERAAENMGLKNPIGTSLSFWGEEGGKIVGIVKDFHFESLHHHVFPMIIRCRPSNVSTLYVKVQSGKTEKVLQSMVGVHEEFSELPFKYHFLDQTIGEVYQEDKAIQKLAGVFSTLAIIISCLGLLGLASFTTQQRTKEVAIRKVLGANILAVINLLLGHHFRLILIGTLIGIPIIHYWVSNWLDNFAYRVDVEWWTYGISILLLALVAMGTIVSQSLKVAISNPVDSLKDE